MTNYERILNAYYRGQSDAAKDFERTLIEEVTKARQESYIKGFREGQQYQADNVRRVLVE